MKPAAWIAALGLVLPLATSAAAPSQQSLEALRAQAQQGNVGAQLDMGILYEYGFNFPDNKAPALAWYTLAAEQGNELAAKRRDVLKSRMTAAEIAEAEKLGKTLATRADKAEPPVAPAPAQSAEPAPPADKAPAPAEVTPLAVPEPAK